MLQERLAQAAAELDAMRERAEAAEKRERDAIAARQQQQRWQPQHSGILDTRGIPHTALLGNHDAEPYIQRGTRMEGNAFRTRALGNS